MNKSNLQILLEKKITKFEQNNVNKNHLNNLLSNLIT